MIRKPGAGHLRDMIRSQVIPPSELLNPAARRLASDCSPVPGDHEYGALCAMRACATLIISGMLGACGPGSVGIDSDASGTDTTGAPTSESGDDTTTAIPTTGVASSSSSDGSTGDAPVCTPEKPGTLLLFTPILPPADGQMVWTRGLALDADDVAYVGGALQTNVIATPVLARVAGDGVVLGTHTHTPVGPDGLVRSLARAPDGTLYLAGDDPGGVAQGFVAAFASDGAALDQAALPGDPTRRIAALTTTAGGHLIAGSEDADLDFWLTAFTPQGEVLWNQGASVLAAGVATLAVAPDGRVAAAHGLWNPGPDTAVEFQRLDATGAPAWSIVQPGVNGPGATWAVAFAANGDVLTLRSHYHDSEPETGRVELVAHAVEDGTERWRTTIVSDPKLWLMGHSILFTPEGELRVVYTQHMLANSLQPVGVGVAELTATGELLSAGVLSVDVIAGKNELPQIVGGIGPCDTLWVWDARGGGLRKFQL